MGRGEGGAGGWSFSTLNTVRYRTEQNELDFVRRNRDLAALFTENDLPDQVLPANKTKLLDLGSPSFCAFSFSTMAIALGMGAIAPEDAIRLMRDGRMSSRIMELNLVTHLGLKEPENINERWDLEHEDGSKSEVRCLTKHGISYAPSNLLGKGREFTDDAFTEKLDLVKGFYVADVQRFPAVDLFALPSENVKEWHEQGKLGSKASLGSKKARRLLEEALPPAEAEELRQAEIRRAAQQVVGEPGGTDGVDGEKVVAERVVAVSLKERAGNGSG